MGAALAVSIDGERVEPSRATISIFDDGLLRGDGVFEMVKLYAGSLFRLGEHLDRIERSGAAIELPVDRPALEAEIAALLEDFEPRDAGLRIVVTRGGRRILILEEIPDWPASARIALIEVTPSELLGGVKSISYAANMQTTRIAAERGADEGVWVHPDGTVLEAPTSSIFWVRDGELRTPSLECRILDSITRRVVIERHPVQEGRFAATELTGASEAFLASTTREIQPIAAVDGRALPEAPGPVTRRVAELLDDTVTSEVGP